MLPLIVLPLKFNLKLLQPFHCFLDGLTFFLLRFSFSGRVHPKTLENIKIIAIRKSQGENSRKSKKNKEGGSGQVSRFYLQLRLQFSDAGEKL